MCINSLLSVLYFPLSYMLTVGRVIIEISFHAAVLLVQKKNQLMKEAVNTSHLLFSDGHIEHLLHRTSKLLDVINVILNFLTLNHGVKTLQMGSLSISLI